MEEFLKWLKEMTEDLDSNSSIRMNVNGKPVIDIENGVDMLKKTKYDAPKCEVKDGCTDDSDYSKRTVAEPDSESITITPNVYKDPDEETYYVRESANGSRLSTERPVVFDFKGEDGITNPGFTDVDLAYILLYRNRDNKVRYNALVDFLKSF